MLYGRCGLHQSDIYIREFVVTTQNDIAVITLQEQRLQFDHFSEEDAWNLGTQMREVAVARALPIVIDIRIGGKPLFYTAMAGTTPENPDWVRRKVNTVLRFEKSSYRVGLEYKQKGQTFDAARGLDLMNFAPAGGGFPITLKGLGVVGVVTVSGLPQRDDHAFVVENIATFIGVPLDGMSLSEDAD
jgi:uncharacterized protein (UPF0303 family)